MAEIIYDPAARLLRVLDGAEPELRDEFLAMVAILSDSFTLAEIAAMVESGQFGPLLLSVDRNARALASVYNDNWLAAGDSAAEFLNGHVSVVVNFDMLNERAVRAMRENQLRLVQGLVQGQRDTIRTALLDGQLRGANPIEVARAIRDSLGLTPYQLRVIENYRRALETGSSSAVDRALRDRRFDRTVEAAIRGDRKLSQDQIDKMVERYRERWVKYRAEVVGRTEGLRATHQGNQAMYQQAIDEGLLDPFSLERKWTPARDARVRDSHQMMRGQVRGLNEAFESGLGNALMYPGDPSAPAEDTVQCRCALATRVKALRLVA